MESLELGELFLIARPSGLDLNWQDGHQATVPNNKIDELKAFLEAHYPTERRVGFRVPLLRLSEAVRETLEVTLRTKPGDVEARAVDLSLTGILIEVRDVSIRAGAMTDVTLCLHDDCVHLRAKVVRRDGDLMALHFPSCVSNGELDPPDALLGIYRELELEWLKGRVHS